ncbi:MAG: type IV pilus secretin PilQ [Mariprofundaceae bacterium]|nr:type IV pilus secretin PilQ [Mariprofundaceae bacterium]
MKLLNIALKALGKSVLLFAVTLAIPNMAAAAQINGVSLMDSDGGDVLRVEADAPLEYQVFDLDGPPRMVINFPAASMSSDVTAMKPDGKGVTSVFPATDGEGVRLEVGLSEMIGYEIEESGNTLVVRFEQTGMESTEPAVAAVIKDIEVRDRGSVTELVLRGENMDASHNAFLSNDNRVLILDFWEGESKLPRENYKYSTQRINDVTIGQAEGRVRLVIGVLPGGELSQQIDAEKDMLTVRFGSVAPARRASAVVVESVNFQPDDRIAHLMVRTDVVNPILNVTEKDGNVIIDVKKAALAEGQERSQDVSAFPGPVRQIDSYAIGEKVRIVARLRDRVDVTSFQQGNVFTVNLEPQDLRQSRADDEADGKFTYTGKKVTFDFKDIDITNALKLISEMSDLNIIMSDNVKGNLTMRLVDVPWDQALDLILSSQDLGKAVEGNVMRIAPLSVLRQEHKEALESIKDVEMLEPLITEPIALSFARVDTIKAMLDASKAAPAAGGAQSPDSSSGATILSPRGSYLVDDRTNTLIVTDTAQAISNVKRFISIVDKPTEQVLIEARIVEATDNFTQEFGIRWGGQATYRDGQASDGGPNLQVGSVNPTASNGFLVDLPAASATSGGAVGISWAAISHLINLDLELSAAEVDGIAKVVSSPRILTANGGTALISQGSDVPFVTPASGAGPATVSFKKAELKLQVTPQITANRTVIMEVDISKDAPTGQTVQGNPILSTKQVTTNLQVKDGETIVIGGIFTRDKSDNESGVPGMKDIPLLGWLFKTKSETDNKTELLIFLTPTIVRGDGGKTEGI